MLRLVLALVLLVGIAAVAVYARKTGASGVPAFGGAARDEARELGSEAREKLAEWGQGLQDAKITAAVRTALGLNGRLRPYSIKVDSERGVVTLPGRVEDDQLRTRAESVSAAVPGVTRVVNKLEAAPAVPDAAAAPTPAETVGDKALETRVKVALSLNRDLRGVVSTTAERDLAGLLARDGAGASVENAVEIRLGLL